MAGHMLNVTSLLTCPHGGQVQIVPADLRAQAGGAPLATANDVFTVIGCPFQIPAVVPIPSPCVIVRWVLTDLRIKAGGARTLSQASQGICYSAQQAPQGPVMIRNTQQKVSSQ